MDSTLIAKFPTKLIGAIVMDIGMGNGNFAKNCLDLGASVVYGFEPRDDKFIEAENKLADYGQRARIYKQAICRSDKSIYQLYFKDGIISEEVGVPVDAVRFDFIVSHLPHIDIVRLNCNGGEFPILMTSKHLNKIRGIVGTTKGYNASKMPTGWKVGQLDQNKFSDLKKYLQINGFCVERDGDTFLAYKTEGFAFYQ